MSDATDMLEWLLSGPVLRPGERPQNRGCSCKLPAADLERLLRSAWRTPLGIKDESTIGGWQDAGVFQSGAESLMMTCDFSPPASDILRASGAISALHALSDIYAKGGVPLAATIHLCLDVEHPEPYGVAVLEGLLRALHGEAVRVAGGHTIVGKELTVGLSATGGCRAAYDWGRHFRVGENLYLSKSLGAAGLIANSDNLPRELVERAYRCALTSNKLISDRLRQFGDVAVTDVSGFGLIGQFAVRLPRDSGVVLREGALKAAQLDSSHADPFLSGPGYQNMQFGLRHFKADVDVSERWQSALAGPETNGPLLISASQLSSEDTKCLGLMCIGEVVDSPILDIRGG